MKKIYLSLILFILIWSPFNISAKISRLTVRSNALYYTNHVGPFRINNRTYNYDCSGLILTILEKSKIYLFHKLHFRKNKSIVFTMYNFLRQKNKIFRSFKNAKIGDLIFFSNTYDANKNNLWDDKFTHIAIIIDIDSNNTITYIHKSGKGIKIAYMNLTYPHRYMKKGKILNSFLRRKKNDDSSFFKYLSGELFTCFGSY